MALLIVTAVVSLGIWMGFKSGPGWRGALLPLLIAAPFAVLAMVFLGFCRQLTFADMLALRYVRDSSCLLGGIESNDLAIPYVCLVASAVAALRFLISKPGA